MTTALDIELGSLASDLIGEFGKTVQYTPKLTSNYDPQTAQTFTNASSSIQIKALVENYIRPLDGGTFDPASLISANDKKVTVAAYSFVEAPKLNAEIIIDGASYKVVNIKEQYINDNIATFELRVRR